MFVPVLFSLISLLTISVASETAMQDFCIGNPAEVEGPAGYSCKKPSDVTVDNFIFPGFLNKPKDSSSILNAAQTLAFYPQFLAVNGVDISANYVEIYQGGVVPLHTHPRGSELAVVIEGNIRAGFISTDNEVYYKILKAGDLMVVPQGLLHFQQNVGRGTAKVIISYSSSDPGIQLLPIALFANNLTSDIMARISFLDVAEVKKHKAMFGGTN